MDEVTDENNTNEAEENTEKSPNTDNVINTIRPVILMEYCLGIFRFSAVDGKLLPPTGKMKVYSVVLPCIITIICILMLKVPYAVAGENNFTDIVNEVINVLVLFQYVTAAISTSFFSSDTNIRIFSMFAELDTMLNIDDNQNFYTSSKALTRTYIIVFIMTHIILCSYDLISSGINVVKVIGVVLFFYQCIEILIFCVLIHMLKHRLHITNDYILKFTEENDNNKAFVFTVTQSENKTNESYNWIGRPSDKNMKIHDLATAYDYIGTIGELINNVFNFEIFLTLVSVFFYMITAIWISLYYYLSSESDIRLIIFIVIFSAMSILYIAVLSFPCEALLSARKNTRILVNKIIMDYDLPKTMRVQAKAFMELIEVWPLSISVYDMFVVDITLVLKFISVATTNLIVIIQISHFI